MSHRAFEGFISLCIVISTFVLMFESKFVGDGSTLQEILSRADLAVNICFSVEFVLKLISLGFGGYFSGFWNRLNFFIVFTSDLEMLLTLFLSGPAVKILGAFRLLRAMRILRFAAANFPGLQILMRTAGLAASPLVNSMVLVCCSLLVLGIIGMQIFGGKMKSCSDGGVWTLMECVGLDEEGKPRIWKSYDVNFDNIGTALVSQLLMSSEDEWPLHMWAGVDVSGKLTGPIENQMMPIAPTYFMLVIVITSAVLVNTVVGIIVENYEVAVMERHVANKLKEDMEKSEALKRLDTVFENPTSGIRRHLFLVVSNTWFDMTIAFFIVSSVIVMSLESWKPASWQVTFGEGAEFFFAFVFGMECIVKIWALRPIRYLADSSHAFDFTIVLVSYIGFVDFGPDVDPSTLRVMRIFRLVRILRTFRIFESLKGLQQVVRTVVQSVPAICEIAVILLLVFFIFAVVSVTLLGSLCVEGDETAPGLRGVTCFFTQPENQLERHAHFQGIGASLLTLFRIATGDNWGVIMFQAGLLPPPREPISAETLAMYAKLFGRPFVDPGDGVAPSLAIASQALSKWKSISAGRESEVGWPFPAGAGEDWIVLARLALPSCLHDDEAAHLSFAGLANCDIPEGFLSSGPLVCPGTCGMGTWVAYLYFCFFYCLAAFMFLQLVIGVMMDVFTTLTRTDKILDGCEKLTQAVLTRIVRRWRYKAHHRMLWLEKEGYARSPSSRAFTGAT